MAAFLSITPQIRLFESIICENYYKAHDPSVIRPDGSIPEALCKVESVQGELAMLDGFKSLFTNIPGVLLAIPYGVLADKIGRKKVLMMTCLGLALEFASVIAICWFRLPIKFIWGSALFLCIGGGAQMIGALILMVLADVTPDADRTTAFFQLQGCVLVSELIAPPVSAWLMSMCLYYPLLCSLALLVFAILVACALPETRGLGYEASGAGIAGIAAVKPATETEPLLSDGPGIYPKRRRPAARKHHGILSFLKHDINVTLLVMSFLMYTMGRQTMMLLIQYVSKRYNWTLAMAGELLSVRAAFNLILLLVILPILSSLAMTKFNLTVSQRDLWISRISVFLVTLGFFGLGLSPTPPLMILSLVLYTLGSGFGAANRSLATTMVHPDHVGKLYTAIAVFDTIGALIAGPTMGYAFKWGLKKGPAWMGMPFVILGIAFVGVSAVMGVVRVRGLEETIVREEESEGAGEEDGLLDAER
ncbi:major facilitator superfamily domain-containing protein [Pyronema omphalodes]|nr:major facilitator superfamily domain-containing protein [Pyronema omphalodes]